MQHASKSAESLKEEVNISEEQKAWILAETQGMAEILLGINKVIADGGHLSGLSSPTLYLIVKNRLDNLNLVILTYRKQIKDGKEGLQGYLDRANSKKKMLQELWAKIV